MKRRKPRRASTRFPSNPRIAGTDSRREQHPEGELPQSIAHHTLKPISVRSSRTAGIELPLGHSRLRSERGRERVATPHLVTAPGPALRDRHAETAARLLFETASIAKTRRPPPGGEHVRLAVTRRTHDRPGGSASVQSATTRRRWPAGRERPRKRRERVVRPERRGLVPRCRSSGRFPSGKRSRGRTPPSPSPRIPLRRPRAAGLHAEGDHVVPRCNAPRSPRTVVQGAHGQPHAFTWKSREAFGCARKGNAQTGRLWSGLAEETNLESDRAPSREALATDPLTRPRPTPCHRRGRPNGTGFQKEIAASGETNDKRVPGAERRTDLREDTL